MTRQAMQDLAKETVALPAEGLLAAVLRRFGERAALASSLGAEDQVVTDMLCRIVPGPAIFTLDTGRLPPETYDAIEATRRRYGVKIEVLFPDRAEVEAMVTEAGPNLFYASVEARRRCCQVRKVAPLRRKLAGLEAWITGLRRGQSPTRQSVARVEWDEVHGLIKVNPLADWTSEQVWEYLRRHDVPYNRLHNLGYPSIGCAPCTRAVPPGEDARSGRWWWERADQKECGLHVVDGRLTRMKR